MSRLPLDDKIEEVWKRAPQRDNRGQVIALVMESFSEAEKERAARDWVGSRLSKLKREQRDRIQKNLDALLEGP